MTVAEPAVAVAGSALSNPPSTVTRVSAPSYAPRRDSARPAFPRPTDSPERERTTTIAGPDVETPPANEPLAYEPPRPSRLGMWWGHAKESIGADIATHGLAYLGVLLLFVGVFGLVAFAFGDVAPTMRPVAEIGIALAPFVAAWMLLRRGAQIAGRALELAGGLLLPIMLVTSFLDGVELPPDLTGTTLVVTLTTVSALVAVAYALWSTRHHQSALRYLVAPIAWLSVAMATLALGRDIPEGKEVALVSAQQVAAMSVAVVASLAWARRRPEGVLSAPTITSSIPGSMVVAILGLLTWVSGGFPAASVLVTGVAGLMVLALLDARIPDRTVRITQPLWWAVVSCALLVGLGSTATGVATAGVISGVGFLALLEADRRIVNPTPASLSALGALAAYGLTWSDPWYALAASVVFALWAGLRRLHPYAAPTSAQALDVVAALTPVAAVVALGLATKHAPLALLVGCLLVLAAVIPIQVPAVRWVSHRDENDHFWTSWWDPAMVTAAAAVVILTTQFWPDVVTARWMSVAAPAVLALSAAVGPLPRAWRAWPTLALASWSWWLGATLVGAPVVVVAGVPAAVALVVVLSVHVAPSLLRTWSDPGSLGLAGHVLALVAVALSDVMTGWLPAVLVTATMAGFVVTAAYDEAADSPVMYRLVAVVGPPARYVMLAIAGLLVPTSFVLLLDAAHLIDTSSPWVGAVVSVVAMLYAAATRLRVSAHLRTTFTWLAIPLALVGLVRATDRGPALLALVAVMALPALLVRGSRPRVAQWLAWASVAPATALATWLTFPGYAALPTSAALSSTVVVVGGALMLAAFGYDAVRGGWVTRIVPTPWLRPAALLGSVEVTLGIALTPLVPESWAGWITMAAAVIVAMVALVARVWSLLGLTALLAWTGAWQLWADNLEHLAWVSLLVTVALMAGSEVAYRIDRASPPWAQATYPLIVVAHLTALTAALSAGTGTPLALTLFALGGLTALNAASLHRRREVHPVAPTLYGMLGASLVIAAGAVEGYGWLALALAFVSVVCSMIATRVDQLARWVLVGMGSFAALGAWLSFAAWLDLSDVAKVDWTSAICAAVALATACLLRWTNVDRVVLLVRGSVALLTLTCAPLIASSLAEAPQLSPWVSWPTAAAALAAAVSAALAAESLAQSWLRFAAVAYGLLAVVEGFVVAGATAGAQMAVLAGLTLATALVLLLPVRQRLGTWLAPAAAFGTLTTFAGLGVATLELPDAWLAPVALLIAAVYSAALGQALRQFALTLLAPVLACAAWIAWAAEALDGNPQWYTVPIGLTLLAVVTLLRHRRRGHDLPIDSSDIVTLEIVGVGFVVGSSFVQTFTVSLAYAVLAALLGACVVVWGLLTRVRRRLALGVGLVLTAVGLLIVVPVAAAAAGVDGSDIVDRHRLCGPGRDPVRDSARAGQGGRSSRRRPAAQSDRRLGVAQREGLVVGSCRRGRDLRGKFWCRHGSEPRAVRTCPIHSERGAYRGQQVVAGGEQGRAVPGQRSPRDQRRTRTDGVRSVRGCELVGLVGQQNEVDVVRGDRGDVDLRVALVRRREHVRDTDPGEHVPGVGRRPHDEPRVAPHRHHDPEAEIRRRRRPDRARIA